MSSSNPGGEWRVLANSVLSHGYEAKNSLGNWLENNGFANINMGYYYWSSSYIVSQRKWFGPSGVVGYVGSGNVVSGILLVHPGQ